MILLLSASAYSQKGLELKLGVEGGVNLANVLRTPDIATSSRTGIIAGSFIDIGFSKTISVVPGVYFVAKGWSDNFVDENGNTVTETIKLSYLEIPILVKISLPFSLLKSYLFAGPQMGINLSAANDQTGGISPSSTDVSSSIYGTDFGFLVGGMIDIPLNKKMDIFAKFGYPIGLTNIFKNDNSRTIKNVGIHITAGMMFGL